VHQMKGLVPADKQDNWHAGIIPGFSGLRSCFRRVFDLGSGKNLALGCPCYIRYRLERAKQLLYWYGVPYMTWWRATYTVYRGTGELGRMAAE
jgi:hypothetical protein